MDELENKLVECFQAVFPKISRDAMAGVSMKSNADWDSMATITLISLIEESFGIETSPEDIEHLASFESIRAYLRSRTLTVKA